MNAKTNRAGSHLAFLDGLRGLAALYVMLGHARWLLWEGREAFAAHAATASPLAKMLALGLALLRYGHDAVLFFFVLSGFVIHLRYAAARPVGAPSRFDLVDYLRRRARRIYPPLLGAMVLTWLLDRIGVAQGYSIYTHTTPYPMINAAIGNDHGAWTALGNAAFLMTVLVPTWGTDGPLWSLHYEGWFYLLYPFLWRIWRISARLALAAVFVLYGLSVLALLHPQVTGSLGWLADFFDSLWPWWLGTVLADLYARQDRVKLGWLAWAALLLPVLLFLPDSARLTRNLGAALGFTGAIAWFLSAGPSHRLARMVARLRPLGDCSYTLYVTHFPILALLSGWVLRHRPDGLLPSHFGFVLLGAVLTLAFAWCAHFVLEKPFLSSRSRKPAAAAGSAALPAPLQNL